MKKQIKRIARIIPICLCGGLLSYQTTQAQSESVCHTNERISPHSPVSMTTGVTLPCVPSTNPLTDFNSFYVRNEHYKPINGTVAPLYVHKTIKILFHVMQPTIPVFPKINYIDDSVDRSKLQAIVDKINSWLSNVPAPSAPKTAVCGTCHVTDSRFRVEMAKKPDGTNDIRFHPEGIPFENIIVTDGAGPSYYSGELNDFFENKEGVLNVFLMYTSNPLGPLGGVSMGRWESLWELLNGGNRAVPFIVTENYYRTSSIDLVANNLLHEIGHTMATHHTFESETCDQTNIDYLSDAFGTTATGTRKCPLTMHLEDVFMNYNAWGNYMTPIQIARWHRNAHFLGCRKYIYNTYPEDKNHSHTGQGQLIPHLITKNETWDFDIKMYNDIVVKSGNKLSIKCRVLMPYHANIIVEPGAELEIDGGIITSHHDTTMWYGISVLGDANKSQEITSEQGLLTMKNGATLSNAVRAINVGDAINYDSKLNGGIIRIDNSNFINNRGGILWMDYHNKVWEFKAGVWARTRLLPNRGYISKSNFTIDNKQIRDPRGQVCMSGVEGISIRGCNFNNTMPFTPTSTRCTAGCPEHSAIITWNANFTLDDWTPSVGSSPSVPSIISGFRHGVLGQSFAVSNPFKVLNTTFENNLIGLATSSVNMFTVKGNHFRIENPITSGVAAHGAQLRSSSLYQFYNNVFDRINIAGSRIGVEVISGGSDYNKINNNFFNDMNIGSLSTFNNTNEVFDLFDDTKVKGLEFLCNDYKLNMWAIHIKGYPDASGVMHDGIRRKQGTSTLPAGNTFSRFGTYDGRIESQNYYGTVYTLPLDQYWYYSPLATHNAPVSINVTKVGTEYEPDCALPEELPSSGSSTGGASSSVAASTARSLLAAAYEDYSSGRFERLDIALQHMQSPYAEIERALLHMQEGLVQQGLGIYYNIAQNMPLSHPEQNDFAQGAVLMRLIAARYNQSNTPRWDSLSGSELDSIRYVRDHSKMWAQQRACAWLSLAIGEYCPIPTTEVPSSNNNLRQSQEQGIDIGIAEDRIQISPNPSYDYYALSYSLQKEEDAVFIVHDLSGRRISTVSLDYRNNKIRLDARNWASGIYLYRVQQGTKIISNGKLVKF